LKVRLWRKDVIVVREKLHHFQMFYYARVWGCNGIISLRSYDLYPICKVQEHISKHKGKSKSPAMSIIHIKGIKWLWGYLL
jgi:hypothetical protein